MGTINTKMTLPEGVMIFVVGSLKLDKNEKASADG